MENEELKPSSDSDEALRRRFVRVLKRHENGLVMFEFSIGWPDLAVELMLPQASFDAFCQRYEVTFLTDEKTTDALHDRDHEETK
jgi:phenol/toluene 2-monooxygenase (NADH) P0/A0